MTNSSVRPLVSVVTPVYNTEAYIAEAIESVIAQTYENWEYVIANNHCTDRSAEIAREYAARDKRIRVIDNKDFLPQIPNYNNALRLISPRSKYCKVIQADDWMFEDCLERMVEVAERNESVAIVSAYQLKGAVVGCQGLKYEEQVVPGRDVCRMHLLERKSLFGNPSSLLYRADLVRGRDPFYDENSLLEDTEVCYELLRGRDFGFVHAVLVYLRVDNESITSQFESFNPYLLHELILLKKYGPEVLDEEEYERRSQELERMYRKYLGEAVLSQRQDEFWEYHLRGLQQISYRLTKRKLMSWAAGAVADLALNPKTTIERLVKRLKR